MRVIRHLRKQTWIAAVSYLCLLGLGLPISAASLLYGQAVSFTGAPTYGPGIGLTPIFENNVAVDGAGNLFFSGIYPDEDGTTYSGRVVELPRTATGYGTPITLPTNDGGGSIAVDSSGNIFFTAHNEVLELPRTATGYGPQVTITNTGGGTFSGIAVDLAADIFLANRSHNTIVELPRTARGYGTPLILPTSGTFHPWGIAVDLAGDVFFSDTDAARVLELPRTATGYGPQVTLPTKELGFPAGIALNSGSDLFIADLNPNQQYGQLVELPRTARGYGPQMSLAIDLVSTHGVAVDNAGDAFLSNNGNGISELQTRSVNFGSGSDCASPGTGSCGALVLYYQVTASGTLETPRVVTTDGAPVTDFILAPSNCTGAVAAGANCGAVIEFSPTTAGEHDAVLQIRNANGRVLASTPIYGNAPLSGFAITPMTLNGSAAIVGTTLELTSGAWDEAASAFAPAPVNVQSFTTAFDFRLTGPQGDGFTFTLQNAGPYALGSLGGGLGYSGLQKSVAIKFDLYDNAGEGPNSTGLYLDGAKPTVPAIDLTGAGIDLHSGDLTHAVLAYDGATLTLTLTDLVTHATWSHPFTVNIPSVVGANTAYVGFTGASGSDTAIQQILNWTFTPEQ